MVLGIIFGAHDGYNITHVGIVCGVGYLVCKLLLSWWIWPFLTFLKLRRSGFGGPSPKFPLGNIKEMMEMRRKSSSSSVDQNEASNNNLMMISHDIHSTLFPYFSHWQKSHGKAFVYWQGTEPFLYIADPEFLRKMSAGVMGKSWGKPTVFKKDRKPLFGNYGLNMVEGGEWLLQRHLITPAFSPTHLKSAARVTIESTKRMIDCWVTRISISSSTASPRQEEVDVLEELIATTGEIIARTSFGVSDGSQVLEKLRGMQDALFNSNRYVGVPFSSNNLFNYLFPSHTERLGQEIDELLLSIIRDRIRSKDDHGNDHHLLGVLLGGEKTRRLPTRQVVDECKTFFFGGHETTALALSWTLLLLAMHPEWQSNLRDEIHLVFGDHNHHHDNLHFNLFTRLKKMEWVMNEVLRLYPSVLNAQRQAREDIIMVNNEDISISIPKGTNMWIDVVAMHHDPNLWGEPDSDVNLFKPERYKEDSLYGGCKHKMGYLEFNSFINRVQLELMNEL